MARRVNSLAALADIARHTSRRLVVHHHDCLDLLSTVGLEHRAQARLVGAAAPLLFQNRDVQSQTLRLVDPKVAELAVAEAHHLVAG